MHSDKIQHSWKAFLKFYTEQNRGRKTRLGVFEREGGVVNDYWIENGLVLNGIDLDTKGELPTVQVLLDGYSHSLADVRGINVHYSTTGEDDGLDISDALGKTTILRFEQP